jgi:histidyl-tRNA synthetase
MAETITDNAAWREGRPAQVEVAEGELVATVRGIIAAQAAERG